MNIFNKILIVLGITFTLCCMNNPYSYAENTGVSVHDSNRYYKNAEENPVFLVGYYFWASVNPDGYIDHPSEYDEIIETCSEYNLNYIRISLGINRFTDNTDPSSYYSGTASRIPFLYVNGKADLDQWDDDFWEGLRYHIELAKQNNIIVHISMFDGVDFRKDSGGQSGYRWPNSFWNVDNQVDNFYGDVDYDGDGTIDESGEFYQTENFNNSTGIGKYQRKLIDKIITETSSYDNVFYEIGNELLGSTSDWNEAVTAYIQSQTNRPVTVNDCDSYSECASAPGIEGWTEHTPDTPAEVKSDIASLVGDGWPAMEDPDGSSLGYEDADASDLRKAAWYSFAGGAFGWGGFSHDLASNNPRTEVLEYYKNLLDFISYTNISFWDMLPQHSLISNNSTNSLLAQTGSEYLAYIISDSSVTIDLSATMEDYSVLYYNPKTGVFDTSSIIVGGVSRSFSKPSGASDWVVYLKSDEGINNEEPSVTITNPATDDSLIEVYSVLEFSGTVVDSDSDILIISWYIDLIGDGLEGALVKQESVNPGIVSGSITMSGVITNTNDQSISLESIDSTYELTLVASDGTLESELVRSFILSDSGVITEPGSPLNLTVQ